VLIPPQDPDALKMALLDLLESPEVWKNMGWSARNFVESNYSINPWFDRILEVYAKACHLSMGRKRVSTV
ncbi:MAG: hypothetical protein WCA79_08210, partial [Anaerolineales bacterium]